MKFPKLSCKQLTVLFIALLLLDQFTKFLVHTKMAIGESLTVIPNFLWLSHVRNTGVAFGQLQGNNVLMIFIVLIVFGLLLYWHEQFRTKQERVAYTLILVGLFGNLIDRIFLGSVVDFVDLGWWPVFNVADSCISIAFVLLLYVELNNYIQQKLKK